jgi:hypothetical protein
MLISLKTTEQNKLTIYSAFIQIRLETNHFLEHPTCEQKNIHLSFV